MEAQGYDVTYISNFDTHSDPNRLLRAKGFLSVGHDEYYSIEMFRALQGAIGKGLNIAFFSGNTCCGRIDVRPSSAGEPNRIITRIDRYGPRDPREIKDFPEMDTATIYPGPQGNVVFNASSCWWADGISEPPGYVRPSVYTTPTGPDRINRPEGHLGERRFVNLPRSLKR